MDALREAIHQPSSIGQIKQLIQDLEDIDALFPDDYTPLMLACSLGNVEVVQILLEDARINVNKTNQYGRTALFYACQENELSCVRYLLENKNVDINHKDVEKVTPFILSCWYQHIEIVKELLKNIKIEVNARTYQGVTGFFIVCEKGNLELVKLLLADKRVEVNQKTEHGATPIFVASQNGYPKIVRYLLASGREMDIKEKHQQFQRNTIEQAKFCSTSKKDGLETEEELKRQHKKCLKIVKILESFEANPEKVRAELRKKLNLPGFFSLLFFFSFFIFFHFFFLFFFLFWTLKKLSSIYRKIYI